MFNHQPTWDNCKQLWQVLFTTKEREWVLAAVQKLVMGANGQPKAIQAGIDEAFPLTHLEWDLNGPADRERLKVYGQILLGGLQEAVRKPINLSKVGKEVQDKDMNLGAFLEQLMEAYRTLTPFDPEAREKQSAVNMTFVDHAAPDI